MRPLITALRTLTILPIPGEETAVFSRAAGWFPFVGLLIGCILWGTSRACQLILPHDPYIIALILLALHAAITGALHLDGIADVADAFGGGRTKEKILEILKDSRHGTFAVVTLFFVLASKLFLYERMIVNGSAFMIVIAIVFSRTTMMLFTGFLPYAGQNGSAGVFTGGNKIVYGLLALAAIAAAIFILPQKTAITITVMAGLTALLFAALCIQKIGGINGDCIGASGELVEIAVLLGMLI